MRFRSACRWDQNIWLFTQNKNQRYDDIKVFPKAIFNGYMMRTNTHDVISYGHNVYTCISNVWHFNYARIAMAFFLLINYNISYHMWLWSARVCLYNYTLHYKKNIALFRFASKLYQKQWLHITCQNGELKWKAAAD